MPTAQQQRPLAPSTLSAISNGIEKKSVLNWAEFFRLAAQIWFYEHCSAIGWLLVFGRLPPVSLQFPVLSFRVANLKPPATAQLTVEAKKKAEEVAHVEIEGFRRNLAERHRDWHCYLVSSHLCACSCECVVAKTERSLARISIYVCRCAFMECPNVCGMINEVWEVVIVGDHKLTKPVIAIIGKVAICTQTHVGFIRWSHIESLFLCFCSSFLRIFFLRNREIFTFNF